MKQRNAISKTKKELRSSSVARRQLKSTQERCRIFYNVPLLTSVNVVPLMKTAVVVENSEHCIYSIGLKCF